MKTATQTAKTETEHVSRPMLQQSQKEGFFSNQQHQAEPFFGPSTLQPKLEIGQPNDPYEREADKVADQVMRMPDAGVQMKCTSCEDEERIRQKPSIKRTVTGNSGAFTATPEIASKISSTRGSGNPLPKNTQNEMSGKIGADFSGVKVHTDNTAVQLSQDLGAKAFTVGKDIYFNKGQYNPSSGEGKRLMAHELVHTVQQGGERNHEVVQFDEDSDQSPVRYTEDDRELEKMGTRMIIVDESSFDTSHFEPRRDKIEKYVKNYLEWRLDRTIHNNAIQGEVATRFFMIFNLEIGGFDSSDRTRNFLLQILNDNWSGGAENSDPGNYDLARVFYSVGFNDPVPFAGTSERNNEELANQRAFDVARLVQFNSVLGWGEENNLLNLGCADSYGTSHQNSYTGTFNDHSEEAVHRMLQRSVIIGDVIIQVKGNLLERTKTLLQENQPNDYEVFLGILQVYEDGGDMTYWPGAQRGGVISKMFNELTGKSKEEIEPEDIYAFSVNARTHISNQLLITDDPEDVIAILKIIYDQVEWANTNMISIMSPGGILGAVNERGAYSKITCLTIHSIQRHSCGPWLDIIHNIHNDRYQKSETMLGTIYENCPDMEIIEFEHENRGIIDSIFSW